MKTITKLQESNFQVMVGKKKKKKEQPGKKHVWTCMPASRSDSLEAHNTFLKM